MGQIYVDAYGFARSDEGDAWFVGEQYANGHYDPKDLPRPNPVTNYPKTKVEVGFSPERRKQLALAASAAGDERAAWFLFDNSFQATLSPKQRGFIEVLERKHGRLANTLPTFENVMVAKGTSYTPSRVLVRDKLSEADRRKLERYFRVESDTRSPGEVLLSYKLNEDITPPAGSGQMQTALMITAIDRLLEAREDRFARSIRSQVVKGRPLSDRQREVMVQIFERNLMGPEAQVFRKKATTMDTRSAGVMSGGALEARAAGALAAGVQRTSEIGLNKISARLFDILHLIDREVSPEGRSKGVAEMNRAKDPWEVARVLQSAMSWLEAAGLERADAGQRDLSQLFWKAKRELGKVMDQMGDSLKHMKSAAYGDADLREKTIRLAHQNPELREHLLPILKEGASNAKVSTFLLVFSSILTQYDMLLSKNERKKGRENIYRLGHYLTALEKVEKRVQSVKNDDSHEAMAKLKAAVDAEFTPGNPGDKMRKVIDAYVEKGTLPKIPISKG